MAVRATKLCSFLVSFHPRSIQISQLHSSSSQTLEKTIEAAIKSKDYQKIPDLFISCIQPSRNPNPFSFLSSFPESQRVQVIDEILQSFNPLRPRSRPQTAYNCLLSYTLQNPCPLPLSLAIFQRTLRSGCTPVPQMRLLLSSVWIEKRHLPRSAADILMEMRSIGYNPDSGTCNYLISSLCAVDQLEEAVNVLKGMRKVGCIPNMESYGCVIGGMSRIRRTDDAEETMKDMVLKGGLMPRQETVVKVAAAMRANKDVFKAVEMIEFLEGEGYSVGFESYEIVIEGCLDCHEYILAGKVVVGMTERGFIPYIKTRQKVVDGLASVGEWKLASVVRQRFAELRS